MTYFPSYHEAKGADYWTDEYMEQLAVKKGCFVVRAADNVLQIDIDDDASFEVFMKQIDVLESLDIVDVRNWTCAPSKSGGQKRHITVGLGQPLPITQRILLQAVLGSDRKRELLAYAGWLKGQVSSVVFFEPIPLPDPYPPSQEVL